MVAASYQNLEFKHSFQTCSDSFSNSKNYWIPAAAKVIIEKDHQNSVALLAFLLTSKEEQVKLVEQLKQEVSVTSEKLKKG